MNWLIELGVKLFFDGLGFFFPSLKPLTPEAQAQKEKDRADGAEAALKARVEGDASDRKFDADVAADPSKLRQHDANELS